MKKDSFSFVQISCPLCGNKTLQSITKVGQYRLPAHVSICANDGLVFLSPRWTDDAYQDFYQHEYDKYYRPSELTVETDEQKYNNIKRIILRIAEYLEKTESVLDIGAGMGWSLQYLQINHPNIQYFAIESSKHCLQSLKQLGVEILANDVYQSWGEKKFDFIIMRHVLEHFLSPMAVLEKVHRSLTEKGIVYLAAPNMMKPSGSLKNYWFRAVHVFYFSETTLIEFAARAGLTPVLLDSSTSEIWGVFRKNQPGDINVPFVSIYKDQKLAIQKQFILSIYYELLPQLRRFTLPRIIGKIRGLVQKCVQ